MSGRMSGRMSTVKTIAGVLLTVVLLAGCVEQKKGNRYAPTPQELEWACNENRELSRNREGYERVFAQCVSGIQARSATGTDDQADIVEQCRYSAATVYRVDGYYTDREREALNRTYKDCRE